MDSDQNALNLIACLAGAAFFAAFLLTFWSSKLPMALATALYGCGILGCLSPYAYYHFFRGATSTFGRFPTLEGVLPLLLIFFAFSATALLFPFVPQKIALRCGIFLFLVVAPVLIFLKILPGYLQFHRLIHPLDLTWLVYAVLWFRIREKNETHPVSC